jgi:hypothetical protein
MTVSGRWINSTVSPSMPLYTFEALGGGTAEVWRSPGWSDWLWAVSFSGRGFGVQDDLGSASFTALKGITWGNESYRKEAMEQAEKALGLVDGERVF